MSALQNLLSALEKAGLISIGNEPLTPQTIEAFIETHNKIAQQERRRKHLRKGASIVAILFVWFTIAYIMGGILNDDTVAFTVSALMGLPIGKLIGLILIWDS